MLYAYIFFIGVDLSSWIWMLNMITPLSVMRVKIINSYIFFEIQNMFHRNLNDHEIGDSTLLSLENLVLFPTLNDKLCNCIGSTLFIWKLYLFFISWRMIWCWLNLVGDMRCTTACPNQSFCSLCVRVLALWFCYCTSFIIYQKGLSLGLI